MAENGEHAGTVYDTDSDILREAIDSHEKEHLLYWPEFAKLLPPKADVVLDFGCGTGIYTHQLRQKYPQASITGIDISSAILPQNTNERIGFTQGDIVRDFDLAKGPFDLIVAKLVLHYIDDENLAKTMTALIDRLRPGGFLAVSLPHILHVMQTEGQADMVFDYSQAVAGSAVNSPMYFRAPQHLIDSWEKDFLEKFPEHEYECVAQNVFNSEGQLRRFNFIWVPNHQEALQSYARINS